MIREGGVNEPSPPAIPPIDLDSAVSEAKALELEKILFRLRKTQPTTDDVLCNQKKAALSNSSVGETTSAQIDLSRSQVVCQPELCVNFMTIQCPRPITTLQEKLQKTLRKLSDNKTLEPKRSR